MLRVACGDVRGIDASDGVLWGVNPRALRLNRYFYRLCLYVAVLRGSVNG